MSDGYGSLENIDADGSRCYLLPDTTVGRSTSNTLCIEDPRISATHARIRCVGNQQWLLRDLGSKNGTSWGAMRLTPGVDVELKNEAEICFGGSGSRWLFHAGRPAELIARELGGGGKGRVSDLVPTTGILVLPCVEDPKVTIFREHEYWVVEDSSEHRRRLEHLDQVELDGRRYQLRLGGDLRTLTSVEVQLQLATAELRLEVSRNEEHVQAHVVASGRQFALPAHNHTYLLVVLARARIRDREFRIADDEAGWCRVEDVLKETMLSSPEALNVQVYRVRKDFASLGFADPGQIIERRRMSGQIRLGLEPKRLQLRQFSSDD